MILTAVNLPRINPVLKPPFHEKLHLNKKPALYLVEYWKLCNVELVVIRVNTFLVEVTTHKL